MVKSRILCLVIIITSANPTYKRTWMPRRQVDDWSILDIIHNSKKKLTLASKEDSPETPRCVLLTFVLISQVKGGAARRITILPFGSPTGNCINSLASSVGTTSHSCEIKIRNGEHKVHKSSSPWRIIKLDQSMTTTNSPNWRGQGTYRGFGGSSSSFSPTEWGVAPPFPNTVSIRG